MSTNTSCPLPPPGTRFFSGPDVRGTLDILFSSLSVVILSTWNVLHLSVPLQSTPRTRQQHWRRNTLRAGAKILWMCMNLLAPEMLIARSLVQRLAACNLLEAIKDLVTEDGVEWSLAHAFLADMRGFEIVFCDGRTDPQDDSGWVHPCYGDPARNLGLVRKSIARSVALIGSSLARTMLPSPSDSDRSSHISEFTSEKARMNTGIEYRVQGTERDPWIQTQESTANIDEELAISRDVKDAHKIQTLSGHALFSGANIAMNDLDLCRLALTVNRYTRDAKWFGSITWAVDVQNWNAVVYANHAIHVAGSFTANEMKRLRKSLYSLQGTSWRVNGAQLVLARRMGIIEKLPQTSCDDIDDRNQSDWILKLITSTQILWLLLQIAARGITSLPVAQIEIVALALAVCALVVYILLWSKPQNVKTTVKIRATRRATPRELVSLALLGSNKQAEAAHLSGPILAMVQDEPLMLFQDPKYRNMFLYCTIAGSTSFGAFHVLAWNYTFPTETERTLWRGATLVVIAIPLIFAPSVMLLERWLAKYHHELGNSRTSTHLMLLNTIRGIESAVGFLYIIVRLYTLVECVRSSFFLEPMTFKTSVIDILPHVG